MPNNCKSFAVVFSYSFDDDCAVYSFDSFDEAVLYLKKAFEEEIRIQSEENGFNVDTFINESWTYARIKTIFEDIDDDVMEIRVASVYIP